MATAPLFRGAHLPLILQAEVAECGLACLAMVASYLGLRTDLAALRGRFPTSLSAISMLTLTEYAQRLSLSTRPLSLSLEELPQLKTPAILHWGLNHFVVLRRATAKEAVIHDPAIGVRHLSYAEVSRDFTRLGAGLIMEGSFTVGMLIALTVYSGMFTARMSALINVFIDYKMLSLHCERLADIVLEPIEPEVEHGRDVDQLVPKLELAKVSYRYSDTEPWVLRNIDLTIEPGDSIAIAGPSGCGKTTLIKLIVGNLKPTIGEIRYGGIPISQLGVRSYRHALAAVMQGGVLLSGSLKENICFYDERPEMDRIRQCAELAQIDADIDRMRMGYETIVADMGSSLSGGQKQRVLLARALYKRPKILVMDEATSALDGALESEVSGAIAELNMTRILVAHRLETIATARRLVALQDGYIVYDAPMPTKNGASENSDTPLPDEKN